MKWWPFGRKPRLSDEAKRVLTADLAEQLRLLRERKSMKLMCIDTETNGLPRFDRPSDHPAQPHLVQYTAILADAETRQEIGFDHVLVRPEGWAISKELSDIHGITHQQALANGVPERVAVQAYVAMCKKADLLIAFGIPFDTRIMRIAMVRCGISQAAIEFQEAALQTHCVMKEATPLCRLPPTEKMLAKGRNTWKTPTLTEAVRILLEEELDGAHDSRVDVLATMRLYWKINRENRLV